MVSFYDYDILVHGALQMILEWDLYSYDVVQAQTKMEATGHVTLEEMNDIWINRYYIQTIVIFKRIDSYCL